MAKKTTTAATRTSRAKAKTKGLELPLSAPEAAQAPAPARKPAVEAKPVAAGPAKPVALPGEAVAVTKTVVKPLSEKAAPKAAARSAGQAAAPRRAAAKAQLQARPAAKPAQRPAPKAGRDELRAGSQDMIATLETCGGIAAVGAESLGKEVVSLARASLQAQFALTDALANAKTLDEALTAQRNFARDSLGSMTEGVAKLTGMSLDLSQKFMAPIQTQMSDTVRAIWRPRAA